MQSAEPCFAHPQIDRFDDGINVIVILPVWIVILELFYFTDVLDMVTTAVILEVDVVELFPAQLGRCFITEEVVGHIVVDTNDIKVLISKESNRFCAY